MAWLPFKNIVILAKKIEHCGLMVEKLCVGFLVAVEFFNCNELCLTDILYKVFDVNKTTPCNDVILGAIQPWWLGGRVVD